MANDNYNFRYVPLTGRLPGKAFISQTEQAINGLAQYIYENLPQIAIVNQQLTQVVEDSTEALEKANAALDTASRVYLTEEDAVDLNDYCNNELIYIKNTLSSNLPVAQSGFLEVKADFDRNEAAQIFVTDSEAIFVRSGAVTTSTVGQETIYTANYGTWLQILTSDMITEGSSFATISVGGIDVSVKDVADRINALESLPHFEYDNDELYLVY